MTIGLADMPEDDLFSRLRQAAVAIALSDGRASVELQAEIIRLLAETRERDQYVKISEDLVGEAGLYPYVTDHAGDARGAMRRESFRLSEEVVLHREQQLALTRLRSGENLVLSAPTSFGKSLLIDALLLDARHRNVVIVVPTLALIDETRRRIAALGCQHRVLTLPSESHEEFNCWILTQERVLEFDSAFDFVDLFIIDEFYKLNNATEERGLLLNVAFQRLLAGGGQFFLLGPNVAAFEVSASRLSYSFMKTDFATVATDYHYVDRGSDSLERLQSLLEEVEGQSIIYVRSPKRATTVARRLAESVDSGSGELPQSILDAADWLEQRFHPDWTVPLALRHGIGTHHGRLPRTMGQFIVDAFNRGDLSTLICTSTLIEGVNTTARNVIVFDHKIAKRNIDHFTFKNIAGRSGRFLKHYVGNVYIFGTEPDETDMAVDIPAISLLDEASSLLFQADESDLSSEQQEIRATALQDLGVPLEVLRENPGVDPEVLSSVWREVERLVSSGQGSQLSWKGTPSSGQLRTMSEILYGTKLMTTSSVRSARQLRFLLGSLARVGLDDFIVQQVANSIETQERTPDEAVDGVNSVLRNAIGYEIPRAMEVLDVVQRAILPAFGDEPGDYSSYAARIRNFFLVAPAQVLEEYGIPLAAGAELIFLASDVESSMVDQGGIDALIAAISELDLTDVRLHPHERFMVGWAVGSN